MDVLRRNYRKNNKFRTILPVGEEHTLEMGNA
jgi:hypothetical protein